MSNVLKTAGKLLLVPCLLFLAACSAPTSTPTPTQDLNPLRTEVAATVLAQVPQLCALTPTITPSPTATQTATATMTPTATATATSGTPGGAAGDKANWVAQSIADDTRFAPGATFNMTWTIQNVGVTTWTTGYRLRFYSGDPFGAPVEVFLTRTVAPNDSIDITVAMKAPAKPGEYRSDWVMSNEFKRNFNEPVFLKIVVIAPGATLTPTTGPTSAATTAAPTATRTPTVTSTP